MTATPPQHCEVCRGPIGEERHTDPGTFAFTCSTKCKEVRARRLKNRSRRRRGIQKRYTPREQVQPKLGPLAKAAMRVETGEKRRKLLVLIAAYADAGEESPAVATLAARTGLKVKKLDLLLCSLTRDGHLHVTRTRNKRNRYQVTVLQAAA